MLGILALSACAGGSDDPNTSSGGGKFVSGNVIAITGETNKYKEQLYKNIFSFFAKKLP